MYGHSLGGAASAAAMLTDSRILGGINMDGRFFSPVTELGVDRPFMNIGRPNHRVEDPTWDDFYGNMRAQSVEIAVAGTTHSSFTDYPIILGALNLTEAVQESLKGFVGTGQWGRFDGIIRSLVVAFGDLVFEHTVPGILRGVDAEFPEVEVVRSK